MHCRSCLRSGCFCRSPIRLLPKVGLASSEFRDKVCACMKVVMEDESLGGCLTVMPPHPPQYLTTPRWLPGRGLFLSFFLFICEPLLLVTPLAEASAARSHAGGGGVCVCERNGNLTASPSFSPPRGMKDAVVSVPTSAVSLPLKWLMIYSLNCLCVCNGGGGALCDPAAQTWPPSPTIGPARTAPCKPGLGMGSFTLKRDDLPSLCFR